MYAILVWYDACRSFICRSWIMFIKKCISINGVKVQDCLHVALVVLAGVSIFSSFKNMVRSPFMRVPSEPSKMMKKFKRTTWRKVFNDLLKQRAKRVLKYWYAIGYCSANTRRILRAPTWHSENHLIGIASRSTEKFWWTPAYIHLSKMPEGENMFTSLVPCFPALCLWRNKPGSFFT